MRPISFKRHCFPPEIIRTIGACEQTTGRRTRISRYNAENENCSGSNHPVQPNVSAEVLREVRNLVQRIVVYPHADAKGRDLELVGELAGLLGSPRGRPL